jgi:hypothetical protein
MAAKPNPEAERAKQEAEAAKAPVFFAEGVAHD